MKSSDLVLFETQKYIESFEFKDSWLTYFTGLNLHVKKKKREILLMAVYNYILLHQCFQYVWHFQNKIRKVVANKTLFLFHATGILSRIL